MYRPGHVGVWMLLYAPLGFIILSGGQPVLAVLGAFIVFVVEPLPDRDQHIPFLKHRGFSHTVVFAVLIGGVVGLIGFFLGDQAFVLVGEWLTRAGVPDIGNSVIGSRSAIDESSLAAFGFAFGAFGIFAHLIADVLTPMGIRPFWPLSSRSFSLSLTKAKNPVANGLLLLVGVAASGGALWFAAGGMP